MKEFLTHIKRLTQLNEIEVSELTKILEINTYSKGDIILNTNKINRKLYFIDKGLVKVSFFTEDKEFVMKFFYENEFCAVLDSLTTGKPSNYRITALTSVNLIEIDFERLKKLVSKHPPFGKIISGIPSMASQKMMSRIRELLETDAKERYLNFLNTNGHLMKFISLKDLSAYLGITQVTLSRIRAEI
ncbi:Crp/Fnr family transcriptional regulator [uncultured Aquimarina sp.]|uniref:Crp/Fnr family transcriptional regulator n=1 Tax=uncultured Aquimarina sp. TaxID=575652 RepID=UPI00261280EE|nr:Crp/Fnr family transcriptional regulator [uncultured Aquimarina sp.]